MKPTIENPARPRTKPAEIRREELLDAAEQLFLTRGIAATSVDAIVGGADVAKGTFYLHFQSKEHLLAALQHGLPDCAGVALGLDRLVAVAVGAKRLSEAMSFTIENS